VVPIPTARLLERYTWETDLEHFGDGAAFQVLHDDPEVGVHHVRRVVLDQLRAMHLYAGAGAGAVAGALGGRREAGLENMCEGGWMKGP